MRCDERGSVAAQTTLLNIKALIKKGIDKVLVSRKKALILAAFVLATSILAVSQFIGLNDSTNILNRIRTLFGAIDFVILLPVGTCIILYIFGRPKGAYRINRMMRRIPVNNRIGETPMLIGAEKDVASRVTIYEFIGYGIPLSYYEDNSAEIESALNANIVRIMQGDSLHEAQIYAVGYEERLPQSIPWRENKIPQKDFELLIGQSLIGDVIADLNKMPHILIGGSTGSGKSVLLKSLVYQCYVKGAEVYIADFKGGLDFNGRWRSVATVETKIEQLTDRLENIVAELESRKILFYEENALDICDYRKKSGKMCSRIVFACDEIAEILDKTGLDKNEKERVAKVENLLSTIARQGRAFGINLILATQRPDANILSGQIRNNIDYRVCGRADDVLSKIVLDNTDASEKIPKYEQGLFLDNMGTVFRAYYFTEDNINYC